MGSRIGWAGEAAPRWLLTWEIEVPVHLLLVGLDPLIGRVPTAVSARLPGRFPPVTRDLAFFVPESAAFADVLEVVKREGRDRLAGVELFDVYSGPGTPEGMRSLAFALRFGHEERTLTEAEVEEIQQRIVAAVTRECGGRLRER
jgi:phenylalanyl-tRNA synthetase beta chain